MPAGSARLAPFCPAHEVAHRKVRRDFDEPVEAIARQRAIDLGQPRLDADLPKDFAHAHSPHIDCESAVIGAICAFLDGRA